MESRTLRCVASLRYLLLAVGLAVVVADANAQLIGRRFLRRDNDRLADRYREMEEYYDDLEDYYEDRDPRRAREAERMEKYYEDLRKGRAGAPPIVDLPGVRLLIEPRLRGDEPPLPPAAPPVPQGQTQGRSRWAPWGANSQAAEPQPAEPPADPQPPSAPNQLRPTWVDEGSELRFPTAEDRDSPLRLEEYHTALVEQLEGLTGDSRQSVDQWLTYLALPTSDSSEFSDQDYYATAEGRKQLAEALEHYDLVASDPQYRDIARLPAFGPTRGALRSKLSALEEQPTLAAPNSEQVEELPVPPAN